MTGVYLRPLHPLFIFSKSLSRALIAFAIVSSSGGTCEVNKKTGEMAYYSCLPPLVRRGQVERGELIVFMDPLNHKKKLVRRVRALKHDIIHHKGEAIEVESGQCWVGGDSGDDTEYVGSIPLALIIGVVSDYVIWPATRSGKPVKLG